MKTKVDTPDKTSGSPFRSRGSDITSESPIDQSNIDQSAESPVIITENKATSTPIAADGRYEVHYFLDAAGRINRTEIKIINTGTLYGEKQYYSNNQTVKIDEYIHFFDGNIEKGKSDLTDFRFDYQREEVKQWKVAGSGVNSTFRKTPASGRSIDKDPLVIMSAIWDNTSFIIDAGDVPITKGKKDYYNEFNPANFSEIAIKGIEGVVNLNRKVPITADRIMEITIIESNQTLIEKVIKPNISKLHTAFPNAKIRIDSNSLTGENDLYSFRVKTDESGVFNTK